MLSKIGLLLITWIWQTADLVTIHHLATTAAILSTLLGEKLFYPYAIKATRFNYTWIVLLAHNYPQHV